MKGNKKIFLGDWISDVYINCENISQNQEIINSQSCKGYYKSTEVYPGGIGFILDNFMKYVSDEDHNNIIYLMNDLVDDTYNRNIFNLKYFFNESLKKLDIYKNNIDILRNESIYFNNYLNPTVKFRYYSKDNKKVFYRFDCDNDIELRYINCKNYFSKSNDLILIDYDKGYLTKYSIENLTIDIISNGFRIDRVFLNTKPHKLELYKRLFEHLYDVYDTDIIIQMNEKEYEPIKDYIHYNIPYKYLIVTRGENSVYLFEKNYKENISKVTEIDISESIIRDVYTTSGAGDIFMSSIMYYYMYKNSNIFDAVSFSTDNMKDRIIELNNKIFV
jgi:hypothetical protein